MKAISQYLDRYAERECSALKHLLHIERDNFDSVVVIPAYDEDIDFVYRLTQRQENILLILVLNQPEDRINSRKNAVLLKTLLAEGNHKKQHENVYRVLFHGLNIILVDRATEGCQIEANHGVGLARKIGADIASTCIHEKFVKTQWIYSTDADAHLPENYFADPAQSNTKSSAKIFEFSHIGNECEIAGATAQYEMAIKYYVSGLAWAKSPYAFYTLGSTLAIRADSYCQVRGFPKRSAGEDFYLLNKLAKVGNIDFMPEVKIILEPRLSDRVPFGTGPAVCTILNEQKLGGVYSYYNPVIFEQLKSWLLWINTDFYPLFLQYKDASEIVLNMEKCVTKEIFQAMSALNFSVFIHHALAQCSSETSLVSHFHSWFDAFRTLKFIRILQTQYYAPLPLDACLQEATLWKLK